MKKDFSFIEKIGIKYGLIILLILIGPEIFKVLKLIFFNSTQFLQYKNMWLDFSIGIFLIFIVTMPLKYFEEKIAVANFGVAFVFTSLQNFIGYPFSLIFTVLFELIGVYFFWLTYKTHMQAVNTCAGTGINKRKILIVFFLLLLPPLVIWLITIIQSRAQRSLADIPEGIKEDALYNPRNFR